MLEPPLTKEEFTIFYKQKALYEGNFKNNMNIVKTIDALIKNDKNNSESIKIIGKKLMN